MQKLRPSVLNILRLIADKEKARHRDYDHVVRYMEEFTRPLTTGENIGPLIHRFNKRETGADHAQRIRLTVATSPAVINKAMGPVRKIPRVKPNVNRADFGLDRKADTEALALAESKFYAGKSVTYWLGSVGLDYGAIDPNAFCLINFDEFDGRYETPRPYPTLISCVDAWNFSYANGELEWLLVHRHITYTEKAQQEKAKKAKATDPQVSTVKGHWFCAYLENHHVVFTQVDPLTITSEVEGLLIEVDGKPVKGFDPGKESEPKPALNTPGRYYFRVSNTELYEVVFYEHKSGMVQAFRMGYRLDANTEGRTCVSLWDPGMPYLLKGIKAGSELDITASLHAFLKELSYVPRCPGYVEVIDGVRNEQDCIQGKTPGGSVCKACGGSGQFRIKSGQDHITFELPRHAADLLPLKDLHTYALLPVEFLVWQDGYKDRLDKLVYEAIYNSEPLARDQIQPTATAEIKDNENVYDTLQPGCDWFSESIVRIRQLIAVYTVKDLKGFVNQHAFPRNLRFESLGNLVGLKKAMKDAGASDALMIQVERDIMDHVFVDDEQALKRAQTMVSFDPFGGKDEATILTLISQDLATKADKVLWANMAKVFTIAEEQSANGSPSVDFYELTRARQQAIIDKIVSDLLDEIDSEAEAAAAKMTVGVDPTVDAGTAGATPPPNVDPNITA